jgi:hypothetical protein
VFIIPHSPLHEIPQDSYLLDKFSDARLKTTSNESWKAHYSFELSAINSFRDDATEYKAENLRDAPPGQPIGLSDEFCGW